MNKIIRPDAPDWLAKKWEEWGKRWEKRHKQKKDLIWYKNKGKGYDDLLKELSKLTNYHCSFCDSYPLESRISHSIDHFKPKNEFHLEAYKWENLFAVCDRCQKIKWMHYSIDLLKPDAEDYDFGIYFIIDAENGDLKPNPAQSPENQQKAKVTIEILGLNKKGKSQDRLNELEDYLNTISPDIEGFSYRFFIQRLT
ncbi:MAG: hypothetical protein MUE85_06140 [Microscillaceae bacterium]|jgi:uncharacterized protein (TIGR02646 family)|nr:hypothetical protein [Microscillaceae bacterium]